MKTVVMGKKLAAILLGIFPLLLAAQDSLLTPEVIFSPDSITAIASVHYQPNSFLRRILMGNNYRKAWQQPVTLPVFHLSTSGFTAEELGGGAQTKSLRLVDALGKAWSLRTVDKDVSGAMPDVLKNSLPQKALQDLISAAFPYASVIAGELAHVAGITAARPKLYYVAADTAFGAAEPFFAGAICSLEERDPGFDSTSATLTVAANMRQSSTHKIQQKVLLKARLFDMLISDWDRHEDNWRWGQKDSAGYTFYYAIPRDRDWAFYKSGGWVPALARWTGVLRHLVSLNANLKDLKNLNWKAATFDRHLLNELTAADWMASITELQTALADEKFLYALQKMPPPIYTLYGENFFRKLKGRRDKLLKQAIKYYRFLTEEIIVNGSDRAQVFTIIPEAANGVRLTVADVENKRIIYQRKLFSEETFSITINGFGGNDVFEIDKEVQSKIRITINGGDGADAYDIKGKGRITINEAASDNNRIINKGNAGFHFH